MKRVKEISYVTNSREVVSSNIPQELLVEFDLSGKDNFNKKNLGYRLPRIPQRHPGE